MIETVSSPTLDLCAAAAPEKGAGPRPLPDNGKLLIVSPVKNEAEFLSRTIRTIVAQTRRPDRWVIVDDGSSDDTRRIAEDASAAHSWISVVHRPLGLARRMGGGVVEAFYAGLATVDAKEYQFICKLDGDLELPPGYFEGMLALLARDETLGTVSGKCYLMEGDRRTPERTDDEMSLGAAKLYRRTCFEDIGGFVAEVMWDGIDCHRCRQLGWKAASIRDPRYDICHLRLMGSSFKSIYHGRLRWGRGQWFLGTHPLYVLAIAAYRTFERPWLVGGACILAGYLQAWWQGKPRYGDAAFRTHLHRWQLRKLFSPRKLFAAVFPSRQGG